MGDTIEKEPVKQGDPKRTALQTLRLIGACVLAVLTLATLLLLLAIYGATTGTGDIGTALVKAAAIIAGPCILFVEIMWTLALGLSWWDRLTLPRDAPPSSGPRRLLGATRTKMGMLAILFASLPAVIYLTGTFAVLDGNVLTALVIGCGLAGLVAAFLAFFRGKERSLVLYAAALAMLATIVPQVYANFFA